MKVYDEIKLTPAFQATLDNKARKCYLRKCIDQYYDRYFSFDDRLPCYFAQYHESGDHLICIRGKKVKNLITLRRYVQPSFVLLAEGDQR